MYREKKNFSKTREIREFFFLLLLGAGGAVFRKRGEPRNGGKWMYRYIFILCVYYVYFIFLLQEKCNQKERGEKIAISNGRDDSFVRQTGKKIFCWLASGFFLVCVWWGGGVVAPVFNLLFTSSLFFRVLS